ncbi:MAG: hypothetical protein GXO58_04320 [Thermodesulfobacteria bacterium]|nr:hypothetical protein [Thermodesulfobacteriota bacterium]
MNVGRALVFFLACFFLGASYLALNRSLCETLEAESALIAKAYVEGKAFLINNLNGQEDLDKPPLYYWTIAAFRYVSPNWELAARLPSLLAVALFLALFWKICSYLGRGPVFFSIWSLIFLMCPKVSWMSQVARMDMFFSAVLFLALYLFIRAARMGIAPDGGQEGKSFLEPRFLAPFFVTTGVSVLIKGPLGGLLIFLTVTSFLVATGRAGRIKDVFGSVYFLLFLLVCVPWYVYATVHTDGRFFHRFILEENLSRFTNLIPGGGFKDFNHSPPTRYLVYFFTGFFPWSLLAPFWLFKKLSSWKKEADVNRLFLVGFVSVFVFFSLALSKRSDYILPLYPLAAFLTADFLLERRNLVYLKAFVQGLIWFFMVLFLLVATGSLALQVMEPERVLGGFGILDPDPALVFYLGVLKSEALVFVVLFLVSVATLFLVRRNSRSQKVQGLLSPLAHLFGALYLGAFLWILPAIYAGKDARPFCRHVKQVVGEAPLYYGGFWDEECTFYLDRVVTRMSLERTASLLGQGQEKVFFILDRKRRRRLLKMGVTFPYETTYGSPVLRPLFLVSSAKIH